MRSRALPKLMPTKAEGESFAGMIYHLDGELVPVLSVDVSNQAIYFEHHILLWKHPQVRVFLKPVKGALKRMIAGMQVFVTAAQGDGFIALSRDGAGHIVAVHLDAGRELHVREHQFLAATDSVGYSFTRLRGISNMLFGGSGIIIDKFNASDAPGIVWLHGYGNVFEKTLAAGEQIDIEPGGWLYKDPEVDMTTRIDRLTSGLFGAASQLIVNRFTGPGRVGIQSMYVHFATKE